MNESTNESKKSNIKRNNVLLSLALFFFLAGGSYAVYYYNYAQYYESTDNAYVGQNIVYVNPQVSGSVDKVLVSEMQYVKEGSVVAHIDSRDKELRFNEAKAKLASTIRNIKQMHVQKEELKNGIALAQVKLDKAKDDLKRNEFLAKNNAITDERYKNLQFAYGEAK